MQTIRNALDELIKRTPLLRNRIKEHEAAEAWLKRADTAGCSWISGLASGTVNVTTENPSFGQELAFTKKEAVREINEIIGKAIIKDIKIRVGSREKEKE